MKTQKRSLARNGKAKSKKKKIAVNDQLSKMNVNASGIDVHSSELWVAVPPDRDVQSVRRFGTFTADLHEMALWLKKCRVTTVAMESTGVYWIAPFEVLEQHGIEVKLVNARHVKNVTGRKSDVSDCQWLQQLHTYGLLNNSFRPSDQVCVLRSYLRLRDSLIRSRSTEILHLQKALQQMNVQLHHVLSDITGVSGLAILRAIVGGERDPHQLVKLVDRRVRASQEDIIKALTGNWRNEHIFALGISLQLYDQKNVHIAACDEQILNYLASLEDKIDTTIQELPPPKPSLAKKNKADSTAMKLRSQLYRVSGVDLTAIEGIGPQTAQVLIGEIGWDMNRFPTEKHFTSWLALCPDHRISAGKILSRKTRHAPNRAAEALRLAAETLEHNHSALGNYHRRMKRRLGPQPAITATAHKMARIVYRLIKHGEAYVAAGAEQEEEKYRDRRLRMLKQHAAELGFDLTERPNKNPVS